MGKKTDKRSHGEYRKLYHNDYFTGRLAMETKMVQWTHIMMENLMFELQKGHYFLDYTLACQRFNKNHVNHLLKGKYFRLEKENKENEDYKLKSQIRKRK